MRVAWFSPVSTQTGISTYSQNVLEEMARIFPREEVDVTVYHPPTTDVVLRMPYPTIEMGPGLLASDFQALFDVAVYHLGNNSKNHQEIYEALLAQPGVVVMHDYVYQHYLAGQSLHHGFVGVGYANMAYSLGGSDALRFLDASQVLRCDAGQVIYVPWESDWSAQVPFCDMVARLGTGAIVHSDYARKGLGDDYPGSAETLFMPRPDIPEDMARPLAVSATAPIHLVFCGHIGSTKGLSLLTSAFRRDPGLRTAFRVTIAGFASDPVFIKDFRATLHDYDLEAIFDLRIGLAEKDFRKVLASADIFFNLRFPNTEGASLSLAEQLAFGRPVIAYPTGCFAEMPADAAYFLDRVGDADELADLLGRIDRERDDLPKRGAAALAAVADKTPGQYARDMVGYLRDNLATLSRRAAIATSRRDTDDLLRLDPSEQAWADAFVASKRMITGLMDGSSHLPQGYFEATADDKGRILALNVLSSRITDQKCRELGAIIDGLDLVTAHHLIGRLIVLARGNSPQSALMPTYLTDLMLPDFDPVLWSVIELLDTTQAVMLGLRAMNVAVADVQACITAATNSGFHRQMRTALRDDPGYEDRRVSLEPFMEMLDDRDLARADTLVAIVPPQDLLRTMRLDAQDHRTIRIGFHDLEPDGLWTRRTRADLHLVVEEDESIREVTGIASLLALAIAQDTVVTFTLTETRSGRTWSTTTTFGPPTADPETSPPRQMPWTIETDGVEGALYLRIEIDAIHSPRDFDPASPDDRKLGVLLHAIHLA